MLSSFSIKNFRSIVDLTVDFTYGEGKAPNGYQKSDYLPFIESEAGERLVPCLGFFGANASGKTNIIKAIHIFQGLISNGGASPIFFDPNVLNRKYQDTTFSLTFILGNNLFAYSIMYNATHITSETLAKNGKPLFEINRMEPAFSGHLETQGYLKDKLADILRVECSDGGGRQTKLFFNRIGLGYQGLNIDIKESFDYIKNRLGVFSNKTPLLLSSAVDFLAPLFNNDKSKALVEIVDVVRRLDIDIDGIDIIRSELPSHAMPPPSMFNPAPDAGFVETDAAGNKYVLTIMSRHKDISGRPVLLNFLTGASAGTQRLAGLVGLFLHALKTGSTLFIDELECSLHPLLMRELVLLFKKRSHNHKGAQLIFTTHNTDILDDTILRVSEIALTRKTPANGTMIRRLSDLKNEGVDIRNVTNFRKQYLEGFYSGIPHPAI